MSLKEFSDFKSKKDLRDERFEFLFIRIALKSAFWLYLVEILSIFITNSLIHFEMIKYKIYRYFSYEFLKIFLITSISLSILLWITQASRLLELITDYGNPISTYIKFNLLNYPKIYSKTILLSHIISIFFLVSKLQNDNELTNYWLAGIGKSTIVALMLKITFIVFLFYTFLAVYLAPLSSLSARNILTDSKFSLINSIVKEKNFNSPLSDLTVYINENDQKGNLEGVFIYEKNRTIYSKKGRVLLDGDNYFLELFEGATQEKNDNGNINIINFTTTLYDFSKHQMKNITNPKFNERSVVWLLEALKLNNFKPKDIREEIGARTIKPFLIFFITIICCFLLYENEKISSTKIKISIFTFSIIILIFNEIFLGLSSRNDSGLIMYFIFLFFLSILSNLLLIKTINK